MNKITTNWCEINQLNIFVVDIENFHIEGFVANDYIHICWIKSKRKGSGKFKSLIYELFNLYKGVVFEEVINDRLRKFIESNFDHIEDGTSVFCFRKTA